MIRILLAEDHNIVRNGIRYLLDKQPDILVVGEASNGLEVLHKIEEIEVDLILTDINMPHLNGLMMLDEIRKRGNPVKVLFLSMLEHENYVIRAFTRGANGYLLKSVSEEEMMFAIRHLMAGNTYIASELTQRLISKYASAIKDAKDELKSSIKLSKREMEILLLIAEGYTNNEIADRLFTSRRTVEGHRQNLLEKTGAKNTATLIRYGVKNGIID